MKSDPKSMAVAYYTALDQKKMEEVKKYFHPNIQFTDPQETIMGKEAVLKGAEGFSKIFKSLTILAKFGSDNEAIIVYEVEISGVSKKLTAASWLTFEEGLIAKINLFYDTNSLK